MNIDFDQMFNDVSEDMGRWTAKQLREGIKELFKRQTQLQSNYNNFRDKVLVSALKYTSEVTEMVKETYTPKD